MNKVPLCIIGLSLCTFSRLLIFCKCSWLHVQADATQYAILTSVTLAWLFKHCAVEQAPFLCRLFNRSFTVGAVPRLYKVAYITPRLKKSDLDPTETRSYRPISNLPVVSKLLERLVSSRFLSYLKSADLMPPLQSAYRAGHSTEMAVTKVLADILLALVRSW